MLFFIRVRVIRSLARSGWGRRRQGWDKESWAARGSWAAPSTPKGNMIRQALCCHRNEALCIAGVATLLWLEAMSVQLSIFDGPLHSAQWVPVIAQFYGMPIMCSIRPHRVSLRHKMRAAHNRFF